MDKTIKITAGEIRTFYMTALKKLDFNEERSRTLSEILLATEDYPALSILFFRVTSGMIDPKALPVLAKKKHRSVTIDGSHTEPHLTCLLAMESACETAAAGGVGMVLVRGLLPVVKLRLYEKVAAAHGLIGKVREAVYEKGTDEKITHCFLAVDPGHFGERDTLIPLLMEFMQSTADPAAGTPRSIDPFFENEGTCRSYTGSITAACKNRDLIEVPAQVIDEWNEIADALEMKTPF